jgi:tape measure domain-containing protein
MDKRLRMVAEFDAATAPLKRGVADIKNDVRGLQRETEIGFREVDKNAGRATAALKGVLLATTALAGAAVIGALRTYGDASKQLGNQLQAIGAGTDDMRKKVFQLAIETRTPIEATVGLLQRMQKSLTTQSLDQTIRQVGTLNRLLTVGGLDGAARGSVALQFGQALQSGVLAGDELRSLREAAPIELLEAIATAAGGTVASLRDLGAQGKLTREVMVEALTALEEVSKEKFGNFQVTTIEAFDVLRTGMIAVVGELDKGAGATDAAATAIQRIGSFLLDNAPAARQFGEAMKLVAEVGTSLAAGGILVGVSRGMGAVVAGMTAAARSGTLLVGVLANVRGALAFFGGPIGLAIAGISLAFLSLRDDARSLGDQVTQLNTKIGEYRSAVSGIDKINSDLLKAREQLEAASSRYTAAVDKEGPAAQNAAALEIQAVNKRIGALNALREARLAEAKALRAEVQSSNEEVLNKLRSEAENDLFRAGGRQLQREVQRAPQGPQREAAIKRLEEYVEGVTFTDAEIQGVVDKKLSEVNDRLSQGLSVSADDLTAFRANNALKAAEAQITLLDQEYQEALEGIVSASDKAAEDVNAAFDFSEVEERMNKVGEDVRRLRKELAETQQAASIAASEGNKALAAKLGEQAEFIQQELEEANAVVKGSIVQADFLLGKAVEVRDTMAETGFDENGDARQAADALVAELQAAVDRGVDLDAQTLSGFLRALSEVQNAANGISAALAGAIAQANAAYNAAERAAQRARNAQRFRGDGPGLAGANFDTDNPRAQVGVDGPDGAVRYLNERTEKTRELVVETVRLNEETQTLLRADTAGGGGSGGGSASGGSALDETNDALELRRRLIRETRTEEELQLEKLAEISTARERLVQIYGEESKIVASLDEATGRLNDEASTGIKDLIGDVGRLIEAGEGLDQILLTILTRFIELNGSDAFSNLFEGLGKGGGGKGGGGGIGGFFKDLFGFANGGIMTEAGPVNLYSNGGIANSPQLAIFGEGRQNEAFVPLPDGRTIPVTLKVPDMDRMMAGATAGQSSGGGLQVNIFENAAEGDHEVEHDQAGGRLDIRLRKEMQKAISEGSLDKSMVGRFGVKPRSVGG